MTQQLPPDLAHLREKIEQIDRAIISLIAERVEAARAVGRAKRNHGLPILDPAREAAVVRRAVELAREQSLAEEDVREIYWHLIGLSRRSQLAGHAEELTP
jgi:chorismate mutase / prephenate dehydrogenase